MHSSAVGRRQRRTRPSRRHNAPSRSSDAFDQVAPAPAASSQVERQIPRMFPESAVEADCSSDLPPKTDPPGRRVLQPPIGHTVTLQGSGSGRR